MQSKHFKKLLVPFDFNTAFMHSFNIACEIAKKSDAVITLLHVVDPAYTDDYNKLFLFTERDHAVKAFIRNAEIPAWKFDVIIGPGRYGVKIVELQRANAYDLLILPDFYRTVLYKPMTGINPLDIMRKGKIPVLIVNKDLANIKTKEIVLPVINGSNQFGTLPVAIALASLLGTKINLAGLSSASPRALQRLDRELNFCEQYLKNNYPFFEIQKAYVSERSELDRLNATLLKKADLIIVSPPIRFFKLKFLLGRYFNKKLLPPENIVNEAVCNG